MGWAFPVQDNGPYMYNKDKDLGINLDLPQSRRAYKADTQKALDITNRMTPVFSLSNISPLSYILYKQKIIFKTFIIFRWVHFIHM